MSVVLELDSGNGRQLTRLFSPRGAALIAMLAKTPRAAAFRAWVLDVLESAPVPALPILPTPDRAARFLTPEARALLRYHGLGLSGPEIAKLLDKSPKTISRWRSDLRAAGFLGQVQHG
jgi:DNA-binding NarL/FixJ family response regulator